MEKLFDRDRFPNGIKLVPLLLYLPVGFVLSLIRFFMGLQTLVAATLLQKLSPVRSVLLRGLCCTLGLIIREENLKVRDDSVPLIVSNHVSILDHVALHLATGSVGLSSQGAPLFIQHAFRVSGDGKIPFTTNDVADLQPEGAITNGKYGLLKFNTVVGDSYHTVQPVSLRLWRPPLTQISPNVLGATWILDLVWFLIVPVTIITIRYLPKLKRDEDETDEEWTRRMERAIASDLKVQVTDKSASYRTDLERQLLPLDVQLRVLGAAHMANRLKDSFPSTPVQVIKAEIERTKNMRLAISNLVRMAKEGTTPTGTETFSECADFPKSARDRMMSFQERKTRLIETARKRYLEKRALNVASS